MNVSKLVLVVLFFLQASSSSASECRAVKFPLKTTETSNANSLFEYFEKVDQENLYRYYYYEILNVNDPKLKEALYKYLIAGNKKSKERIQLESLNKLGHKIQSEKELCEFLNYISHK